MRRTVFDRLSAVAPDLIIDLMGISGASLLAFGAWQVYAPAGYMVGGAELLAGATLLARGRG